MSERRIAVVLMAYGTPRTRDDILPYYTDIRRGRAPTDQQLADLVARYEAIAPDGGDMLSPLADRTDAQREGLQAALDQIAPGRYVVVLGLKHAAPTIETAVELVAELGIDRIVGLVLAPHYSSFSIGQYLDRVRAAAAPHGIAVNGIDSWAVEPAFVAFLADDLRTRLQAMPTDTKVLFTAHSLPQRIIEAGDPYPDELRSTAEAVAAQVGLGEWSTWALAWQSAGRTPEPWLGPDILQVIDELAASEHHASDGGDDRMGVVVCACGFVADHLEVLYDLDIEAAARANSLGLEFAGTACVNDDADVLAALAARVVAAVVSTRPAHVIVVGGGISGLAAAHALLAGSPPGASQVTVLEAQSGLGGKIRTTPFAGFAGVDEGADAFLARVPEATQFAGEVGVGDRLTSPVSGSAAVWWDGLKPIPPGLVLGLPTDVMRLARSRLLSWTGKLRAATEVVRPRTDTDDDSIGAYVRGRFGDQVHERLVDPLVGSIYAADTDRFSLQAVPQLADLASSSRSVLLAARHRPPTPAGPVFYAPEAGMADLVEHAGRAITELGGDIRLSTPCQTLELDGAGWRVDGRYADAVVLACPAAQAARLLASVSMAADNLASIEYADVVLITVAIPRTNWPERLHGLSGYLVPKPVQQTVTAVSFASQKWGHLRSDESVLLRISLGRDGLPVLHQSDERLLDAALTETGKHLGIDLQPTEVRHSNWQRAFPQYRPHHHRLVASIETELPSSLVVAGASYHGIGIPACIRSGKRAAEVLLQQALSALW